MFQNNNNIKIKKSLSICFYFYCCVIQVAFNECKNKKLNNKGKKTN